MSLLDQMAASGRLSWFIGELANARAVEENDEMLWQTWLHKVWNQDWKDFKAETMRRVRTYVKNERIRANPQEAASVIARSRGIMEGFAIPTKE